MAISATTLTNAVPGGVRVASGVLTLDASYPTGGYSITPALVGFERMTSFRPLFFAALSGANISEFSYNPNTQKLQAMTSTGAEVANGTNLSTVQIFYEMHGS